MTKNHSDSVLHQVPPDYYQKGVRNNLFQRIWHTGKLRNILGLIKDDPRSILDVGSASGWFISQVSKNFPKAKCVGVDAYKDAIIYGSKKYKHIKFIHSDAHSLPLDGGSFDLILCTEVLEHVQDPKGVLSEIRRVLKKGGVAVIEMDTGNLLFNLVWYLWTNLKGKVWKDAHVHKFNSIKLEKMIENSGFIVENKKTFNLGMAIVFYSKKKHEN
jgi:ubiquinone/menaquinone biosynthesis C-methylase UbiE